MCGAARSIRAGKKTFVLEDAEVVIDPTCAVVVTMNPGYLGRTELPGVLACVCTTGLCTCDHAVHTACRGFEGAVPAHYCVSA
jgi:hypothetical protein